jgi:hypothetical protein
MGGAQITSPEQVAAQDPRFNALTDEEKQIYLQRFRGGNNDQIFRELENKRLASQVTGLPGVTGTPESTRNPILAELDSNPNTAGLPEATKVQIAGDLNSPLNPRNPNFVFSNETSGQDALSRQADAERILREAQATKQREQIGQFATEFETSAEARRKALADRLAAQTGELETAGQAELGRYGQDLATSRQKTFQQANPYILEDLNRRGLLTSETATADAQARKLAELEAADEANLGQARLGLFEDTQGFRESGANLLNQFDTGVFEEGQNIRGSGLESYLGGNQAALEEALGLRRSKIERDFGLADAASERAFSSSLAKKQRSNDLLSAGIGAVGTIACFDRWTCVDMPNGEQKEITEIKLGDEICGGVVSSIRIAIPAPDDLYSYRGVLVTGDHAVKEKGKWIRVKDAFGAMETVGSGVVYTLITSSHRIFINDIEVADEIEHEGGQYTSLEESLERLNEEALVNA